MLLDFCFVQLDYGFERNKLSTISKPTTSLNQIQTSFEGSTTGIGIMFPFLSFVDTIHFSVLDKHDSICNVKIS